MSPMRIRKTCLPAGREETMPADSCQFFYQCTPTVVSALNPKQGIAVSFVLIIPKFYLTK